MRVAAQYRHSSWNSIAGTMFAGLFAIGLHAIAAWIIVDGEYAKAVPMIILAVVLTVVTVIEALNVRNRVIIVFDDGNMLMIDWKQRRHHYRIEDIVAVRRMTWLRQAGDHPMVVVEFDDGRKTTLSPFSSGYREMVDYLYQATMKQ